MAPRASKAKASSKKAGNVIDIDFDDYEPPRSEYMGEEPQKGVYRFALVDVKKHTSGEGNESIQWIFDCQDEPYRGWSGFMYTGLPASESFFRTQHNVRALQGGKTKALKLDLDNPEKFIKSAKVVLGRVVMEEYQNEYRAKLRTVAPNDDSVKSTKPVLEDDEDEDFEDFEDDDDDDIDEEADEEAEGVDEDDDDFDDEDDDEDGDDGDEEDDDEEDEEDDEEEPEPEPEPTPKRRKVSAKKEKTPAAKKPATKRKSR